MIILWQAVFNNLPVELLQEKQNFKETENNDGK
jgi:hypothetical protein